MIRRIYILLVMIVLSTGLIFFNLEEIYSEEDSQVVSVVNANNQFAFDLYSRYKSKEGNIFFSPYSISTALAMTYEGARGKTADEIQAVFHFPKDESLLRESFLKINNQINKKDKKYQLHTANALWAQKDYSFLEGYLNLVKDYYGGKATNLDFCNQTEESRLTINSWVEAQTNYKIKNLVPQGSLGPLTRLVLTNAVYFKGFWFKQFDKKDTKDENFRVSPGNTIKCPMMYLDDKFNYTETEKLQILELLYEGGDLSMLILLPKDNDLRAVEESLSASRLSEWKSLLEREEVYIYLPKFKFEEQYFMKDTLSRMGMPTAFTWGINFGGEADFSGMTGKKDLNIGEVIHKAFVEVNEEGTEAAAATAVMVQKAFEAVGPIKVFKADHPFIFIIQQRETGNILFLGRVNDPSK